MVEVTQVAQADAVLALHESSCATAALSFSVRHSGIPL